MINDKISQKIEDAVKCLYEKVKSKVFVHGKLSESFLSHAGVRQLESLSPFLFSIYISDLEEL